MFHFQAEFVTHHINIVQVVKMIIKNIVYLTTLVDLIFVNMFLIENSLCIVVEWSPFKLDAMGYNSDIGSYITLRNSNFWSIKYGLKLQILTKVPFKFLFLFVCLCFLMDRAGKTVYFPGSWPIFSQFVKCFYVQKDKISENFPPDSKISLPTPKFPRSFPFPNFSHNVHEDLYNMQMQWSGVI